MASTWAHGWGSNVRWSHLSCWTARGAQHVSVALPPFIFSIPLAAQCWASMYVLPFQSHAGLQQKVQCAVKENCHSGEPRVWLSTLQSWGPIHFRPQFMARLQVFPRARAEPRAAAVEDEGVVLPGVLVSVQDADVLLPVPRHAACGSISPPTSIFTCQVPPTSSCCSRRQSEWSPGTRSLQLLTVYWKKNIFFNIL